MHWVGLPNRPLSGTAIAACRGLRSDLPPATNRVLGACVKGLGMGAWRVGLYISTALRSALQNRRPMRDTRSIPIYHITAIANLPEILRAGGLFCDADLASLDHEVIGYSHIKQRRLTEIRIPCCANRFVGEFVPFYYCPRSPMLYTLNIGNTGKPIGCQREVVHLVSTVGAAIDLGVPWAISDGNAGAHHACFDSRLTAFDALDWQAIRSTAWKGKVHEKCAEFLVSRFFPWQAVRHIGCMDSAVADKVRSIVGAAPAVTVQRAWYY
jgi:hypothetical protein